MGFLQNFLETIQEAVNYDKQCHHCLSVHHVYVCWNSILTCFLCWVCKSDFRLVDKEILSARQLPEQPHEHEKLHLAEHRRSYVVIIF